MVRWWNDSNANGQPLSDGVGYPAHWEADVALRDGGTAHLRPITPADAHALQKFHRAQSSESVYFRFFAPMAELSARDLERFTHVDHLDRVAIIVMHRDEIIGVGRFDRLDDGRTAEIAFNVADHHHSRGIGSVLLDHLAAAARERGITKFLADVLPGNARMISVFVEAGYDVRRRYDDGVIAVSFNIDPTDRSVAVMADREHRAEAQSLRRLLGAQSVMVIGAGRDAASMGHRVLRNITTSGFQGAVHAVNPEAFEIQGVISHARVEDVPGPVDLAVIAVPAEKVAEVVTRCGEAGVHGVVVISAGFAEIGPTGLARQREVVRIVREYGMRLVGPNSFGLLNTGDHLRLNASLAPYLPVKGGLGLFCQSGAMAVSLLASVDRRGIGLSGFLSSGNRADVSGNDMMQFWDEDASTSVVALYLESIGNPRKFSRIARRLSRHKPVIVVKSGLAGYVVPPGHAVRATRSPRETLHEMFRQAGVIRADNVHQLLDFAQTLMHQPLPAGNRMAVVSNSDSLSAVITDAGAAWGLSVARPAISLHAQASAEEFAAALKDVFSDPRVDVVVASFVPPVGVLDTEVARSLAQAAAKAGKTTVASFLGMRGVAEVLTATDPEGNTHTVPAYISPEDAVLSLAAAVRYSQWRAEDEGERIDPEGIEPTAARDLVEKALENKDPGQRVELSEDQAAALIKTYGVDVWPAQRVNTIDEAVAAAERMGWPVAIKTMDEHLRHRTDLGGVRLDIVNAEELRQDYESMVERIQELRPGTDPQFEIQAMAPAGVACVLRGAEDPLFGPVISFGLAGDAIELLGDVAHRVPPLTTGDVQDIIRSVRAAPRLFGYRGLPPMDVASLEDVIGRIAHLCDDIPEIRDLEINPILVSERGSNVLQVRITLARTERFDNQRRSLPM